MFVRRMCMLFGGVVIFLVFCLVNPFLYAQTTIEISSTLNPVGSGARATGMGGAFIGVADDATAASWNPAGLIQLEKPEISFVYSYFDREQKYVSPSHPEIATTNVMDTDGLNYASIVYPFVWLNRNMVFSLNYQRLYEMDKDYSFRFNRSSPQALNGLMEAEISLQQKGHLYTLSPAMAVQVIPELYIGVTVNFWDNFMDHDNGWTNTYRDVGRDNIGVPRITNVMQTQEVSFKGTNAHFGFMWLMTDSLTLGGVYKTSFHADLRRKSHLVQDTTFPSLSITVNDLYSESSDNITMVIPDSYGLGLAYRHSDNWTVAFDIYRTDWEEFVLIDSLAVIRNPFNNSRGTMENTTQVRLGTEYLFIRDKYAVPVRAGLFYDPEPGVAHIDEYYGFSFGTGYSRGRFVFDMSYQFRAGNDGTADIFGVPDSNADVEQHTVMFSSILYFE